MDEIKKLKQEIKSLKEQLQQKNTIGWKGKGELTIAPLGKTEFLLTEVRKSKSTDEIIKSTHIISKKQVNIILSIIKEETKSNNETTYRDVIGEIIKKQDLRVGLDAFNGGKNRAKFYFPLYYFPVKILESKNIINYSGRGKINIKNKTIKQVM